MDVTSNWNLIVQLRELHFKLIAATDISVQDLRQKYRRSKRVSIAVPVGIEGCGLIVLLIEPSKF